MNRIPDSQPDSTPSAKIEPELLKVDGVAMLLSKTPSAVWKLHERGRMPAPRKLGRSIDWSRSELLAWGRVGCPCRETWKQRYLSDYQGGRL